MFCLCKYKPIYFYYPGNDNSLCIQAKGTCVSVTEVNRFVYSLMMGESLGKYIHQNIEIRDRMYLWSEKSKFFEDQTKQFIKVKTKILKDMERQAFKVTLFSCSFLRGSFAYVLNNLPYNQQKRIHFSLSAVIQLFLSNWKGDILGRFCLLHVLQVWMNETKLN